MRILYFTKYSRKGASSRLRSYQYIPYLEKYGCQVEVIPLFGDDYLDYLYEGKKSIVMIMKAYLRRFLNLLSLPPDSLLIIEYELFPYVPAWFEKKLMKRGIKYMVDYDDAIFHNYDLSINPFIKKVLSHKVDTVMRYSSTVIAGNSYLAERAKNAGAKKIEIIPTVIDLERYEIKYNFTIQPEQKLIVGWIGTFSTFKYFKSIMPILEELALKYPIAVHVVGVQEELETDLEIKYIPWTEATEAASIRTFDVGIMPLEDSLWERGKCGYKLIQYMASGLPVIASGVGVNSEIVNHSVNGFIANTKEEWTASFYYFIICRYRLSEMGAVGRRMVEDHYSLQVTEKKLLNLLHELS